MTFENRLLEKVPKIKNLNLFITTTRQCKRFIKIDIC